MFPPAHAPIVVQPHVDELSGRIQSRKPVDRAASALRGVASRLRVLVAPSGGSRLNDGGANLLMSPLSVAAALGEMLLGAQGETRELLSELLAAPGLSSGTRERDGVVGVVPDLDFHQQFKALLDQLTSVSEYTGVDLRVASAFFAQRGLPLRVDFQHALHDLYHADVQALDFRDRPAVAQATVNAWASQATRGRIPSILAAPLPPSSVALVASAVYFNGAWKMPFDAEYSINGWFRMNSRRRVAVRYMRSHFSKVRYAENTSHGYRLVVLPYKDSQTAMYIILPDRKDIDLFAFAMQLSLEKMMDTARAAQTENVTVILPKMTISGSFSLKEPLSKIKALRRVSRSVTPQGAKESESSGTRSSDSSRASDSSIYVSDFESSNDEHHWVKTLRKLRNTHRTSRSAPEPRSQDLKYPAMQITVGTNPSDSTFKRVFPQPLSSTGVEMNDSKDRDSTMRIAESGEQPRVALPLNKPMVLGVPLRIMDSDDSKVVPKAHHLFSAQEKTPPSVKTYQQFLKEIDMPHPYLPGQDMKPPFDKPLKLITMKDIIPKMVVETSVSFPADQSNESGLEGSRLTMRPSGLTITKKQRQSGSNTAIRSVEVTQDKGLVPEDSSASRAFDNENSTNQLPAWSPLRSQLPPKAEWDVESMRVPLNIPNSENTNPRRNSSDGGQSVFEASNFSSGVPPHPTPILSFSSDVKISQPIPIISSSFHVEDTPLIPARGVNPSISSSVSLNPLPSIPEVSDSKDSSSSSTGSLSLDQSFLRGGLSNTSAHAGKPTFPEVDETGDLLNPLTVGDYRPGILHSQAPNSAGYDVELDLTGASIDRRLRVSDALHYVWLEVSETGTEAAAVTATIVDYHSQNKVMKVDRPFVFAIVHEPTEALLFLAAVSDPTGGSGIRNDIPPENTATPSAG